MTMFQMKNQRWIVDNSTTTETTGMFAVWATSLSEKFANLKEKKHLIKKLKNQMKKLKNFILDSIADMDFILLTASLTERPRLEETDGLAVDWEVKSCCCWSWVDSEADDAGFIGNKSELVEAELVVVAVDTIEDMEDGSKSEYLALCACRMLS